MSLRLAPTALLLGLTLLVQPLAALVLPRPVAAEAPVALDQGCSEQLVHRTGDDAALHVMGCDHRDRGRAVIALGDVATARHLVVLVPGSDTDLGTLVAPAGGERPHGLPLDWARSLFEHAPADTAVVLWVGYATPQGLGLAAATGAAARAAAPALVVEVAALQHSAPGHPRTTVIGHSYGAVVVALAAPSLDVDDVVLLASPGAHADDVTQLATSATVWAARSSRDWIGRVPHVRVGDLGHGADPAAPSFGARDLPVQDVTGHDGYLSPGTSTLAAVEAVIAGSQAPSPGWTSPLS